MTDRSVSSTAWSVLLAAAILGSCASDAGSAVACPPSPYRSERTQIIAHASGDWFGPANSIEMLRTAVDAGADIVDLDVRVTADGALVASHDDRLSDRLGNRTITRNISQSTLDELRSVDLRSTWTNRGSFTIPDPVRIPTVAEVIEAFPNHRVSLEFKTTGGEQALCDLLASTDRADDVYVGSAGDAAVDRFKQICPGVVTTVTDAMVPVMQAARESGAAWCAPVPIGQPPLFGGSGDGEFRLTKEFVEWNHARGLAVYTWTADDDASLRHVASLGVDAVYTARPDLAQQILHGDQ